MKTNDKKKVKKVRKPKHIIKPTPLKKKKRKRGNRRRGRDGHPSKFQKRVGAVLKTMFGLVETEVKFRGLVGITGHPLRVDFFVPEWNLVVEADGIQHSDPTHKWAKRKGGRLRQYDEIKNEFFEKNNILLCRIPYCRRVIHDEVKDRVIQVIFRRELQTPNPGKKSTGG